MTATIGATAGRVHALPTRQRRPWLAAFAVVVVVVSAVAGGVLYERAGAKTPVVVTSRKVVVGQVLTREDLSTVNVAGGLTAIVGDRLEQVVGQRAATTLMAGTPVQQSDLSGADAVRPGQAQVGVAVSSAQIPDGGVSAGDTVEVVQLPGAGSGSSGAVDPASVLVAAAMVVSAHPDPAHSGGSVLTLTVPGQAVLQVTAASSAGLIAVVRVAGAP